MMTTRLWTAIAVALMNAGLTACWGGLTSTASGDALTPSSNPAPTPQLSSPAPDVSSGAAPPATSASVVGSWEHQANEWESFVMPYDGIASFKDVHPLAERSEIQIAAGTQVRCISASHGGAFADTPGMSYRFACETHPLGVEVPAPVVAETMMPQLPGMPKIDPAQIPAPNPVVSKELKVRPARSQSESVGNDIGAFRNGCEYSHINFDDFIVYPGQPGAAHAHVYCGNASANAFSTDQSLLQSGTTAVGGTANQSAYWMPALLMPDSKRPGFYQPLIPVGWNNYYKTGYNSIPIDTVQPLPNGLVMIAGNSPSNAKAQGSNVNFGFTCNEGPMTPNIPVCPAGGDLVAHGTFPNCWDGQNLDSPDHRSHMSYPVEGLCPPSHPVAVIQLGFHVHYHVPNKADTLQWKLSCDLGDGGLCLHADAKVLWNTAIRDEWMEGCIYTRGSCQADMGKGRELF